MTIKEYKVLIVDDDVIITSVLKSLLKGIGCQIDTLTSGEQVLHKAIEWQPDLLFLDINLPGKSGFECLTALKSSVQAKHIPVIMLTGVDSDQSVLDAISRGAETYITKPFSDEDIRPVVERYRNKRQNTILIAEDDPIVVALLTRRFDKMGYQSISVTTGNQVGPAIESSQIDLVLLDLMLPDQDGLSVLRDLRSQHGNLLPVFMLSSNNQTDTIVRSFNEGAWDYIVKPFDIDQLTARIAALFNRQQQLRG